MDCEWNESTAVKELNLVRLKSQMPADQFSKTAALEVRDCLGTASCDIALFAP